MHKLIPLTLLVATAAASALQPADVQITTDPAVTVKVTRNKTNTSKQISITVNAQDKVTQIKLGAPAPAPVPAPPPPAPPPAPKTGMPVANMALAPVPNPNDATSAYRVSPTTEIAPASGGDFRTVCEYAKMATIDPIVTPGRVNETHLHTFFGNVDVNESSTTASLRAGGNSTCRGGIANRSAYWVPTMIDTKDGRPLAPKNIGVYYKNGFLPADTPIPVGLRMIAGTSSAKGPRLPGEPFNYRHKCIGGPNNSNDQYGDRIPNCDKGAEVWQEIFFPICWDGKNLDSPDHKSHMSHGVLVPDPKSTQGWFMWVCPASHPKVIPAITFNVVYPVTETNQALTWRLSSDNYDWSLPGGYSSHADWFNGWDPAISDAWFKNCLVAKKDCHSHLLGDGRAIF